MVGELEEVCVFAGQVSAEGWALESWQLPHEVRAPLTNQRRFRDLPRNPVGADRLLPTATPGSPETREGHSTG